MKVFIRIAILLLSFLFLWCSAQQTSLQPAMDETQSKTNKYDESFDPMTLEDYDLDVSSSQNKLEPANINSLLKNNIISDSSGANQTVMGFRVQIASTRDEQEARIIKRNAILLFQENVYMSFDDPYYKVRVGDFISRYDANRVHEKVIEKGFPDSWVVRSEIKLNSLDNED